MVTVTLVEHTRARGLFKTKLNMDTYIEIEERGKKAERRRRRRRFSRETSVNPLESLWFLCSVSYLSQK